MKNQLNGIALLLLGILLTLAGEQLDVLGITAVDDFIRILHQPLYHMKLLLNTRVMSNQFDTETWRNHRQTAQAP